VGHARCAGSVLLVPTATAMLLVRRGTGTRVSPYGDESRGGSRYVV
jgi:hypothetical protein